MKHLYRKINILLNKFSNFILGIFRFIILALFKPQGIWAKCLFVLTITGVFALFYTQTITLEKIKEFANNKKYEFPIGSYKTSPYEILSKLAIVIFIFWVTAILTDIVDQRVSKFRKIKTANRSIIIKMLTIAIYFAAFMVGLHLLGINLTTLAVFSGALGIGLGFGLQKISSNFISGLILLFEKTILQDDLIEMEDGTFGYVKKARARFTLVETPDGKEIMIPNENFITNRVINWTHSHKRGRIELSIGVKYGSDLNLVKNILLEAARGHPRSLKEPHQPKCHLRGFGDSSIDFILHFWVADITVGRWESDSEVLFEIWEKFKEHGIEIPFPQRDLHLKNSESFNLTDKSD